MPPFKWYTNCYGNVGKRAPPPPRGRPPPSGVPVRAFDIPASRNRFASSDHRGGLTTGALGRSHLRQALAQRGRDERLEQRVWLLGTRLELGMKLTPHEIRVLGQLD